jgi:hypothetical protein
VNARRTLLGGMRVLGAVLGYGCFVLFLALVGFQVVRWLREGEWTHIGITEGLHAALADCCVRAQQTGVVASLAQWLDTPVHWLGLHRVLEVLPASLGLFLCSVFGNSLFIYSRDALEDLDNPQPAKAAS